MLLKHPLIMPTAIKELFNKTSVIKLYFNTACIIKEVFNKYFVK
ncbi:hypothetical protein J2125_002285 [Erwinia toletana]|uniref:Uncharacterized protein n=1 Tax=Winslowiella toletana TaxID=92490 RepID=A0ABS4PAX5_9GAMM|nr:hypothetical protein [Winslowiella toletana]